MNEFESFHLDLYHAKLKWMSIQSGYTPMLWNDSIQNQINAISNLSEVNQSIEAHIIAVKSYFGEELDTSEILKTISICIKEQNNKDVFTMSVFNRFKILHSPEKTN